MHGASLRTGSVLLLAALLGACGTAPSPVAAPAPDRTAERVTIAVVQYPIRGDRSADDLCDAVAGFARQAAARGARLCVFPELIVLDCWPLATRADAEAQAARTLAEQVTPQLVARTAALAAELDVAILVGGPRLHDGAVRNTEFLLLPDGRRILQDKLFLTAWERDVGWQPGDDLLVFLAPWGRSAIATCYDVEFPALSQALAGHGVEVLLVPSMTESAQGLCRVRDTAEARAIEHHAFVLIASTVGRPSADWQHFGGSAVLAPQDGPFRGVLGEAAEGEPGIVTAELDLGLLRQARTTSRFFPVRDQLARPRPLQVRVVR